MSLIGSKELFEIYCNETIRISNQEKIFENKIKIINSLIFSKNADKWSLIFEHQKVKVYI